jgi:hypothetical protein
VNTFVLPKAQARGRLITRIAVFLAKLPASKAWAVSVAPHVTKRSNSQNAYLFGVVYRTILESGELTGWTNDDLHEYFLGEWSGWETLDGFGKKRIRPVRRSSKLSTIEFMEFIGFIQEKMAGMGIYIPDANEYRGVSA